MPRKAKSSKQKPPRLAPRTKLNTWVVRGICRAIGYGASQDAAAESEGVSRNSYWTWLGRGRAALEIAQAQASVEQPFPTDLVILEHTPEADRPYVQLALDIERALGGAEVMHTREIATARDWKAHAWWLENVRRDRYGKRETLRLEREAPTMSSEEIEAELHKLGFVQAPMLQAPANDVAPQPTHDVHGSGAGNRANTNGAASNHGSGAGGGEPG